MVKGQLPKAYLRIDPNIDTHPDCGAMLVLMLWANRQPERGHFRTLDTIRRALGKRRLQACLERGDLKPQDDGTYFLEGWNEWQEGDLNVGERMRLVRARKANKLQPHKRNSVTNEVPSKRNGPSETVRRQGVKASRQERSTEAPPAAPPPDPPTAPTEAPAPDDGWNADFADDFKAEYHARPPAQFFVPVKAAVRRFGWSAVRPVLREIMSDTPVDYLNLPKVLAVKVEQSLNGHHPPARAGPSKASGSETMAALERFKARRQVDAGSGEGDSVRGDAEPARGRLPTGTE